MIDPMDVDVVVIGMGPGGEAVAGSLAAAGLEVVGIEDRLVGGECPYWGCIPSKAMVHASDVLAEGRRIPGTAGDATIEPDWAPVAARVEEVTASWDDRAAVKRFTDKGGRLVRGKGRLTGPKEVAVGDEVFHARRGVVIATGTAPAVPPIDGLAGTPFWTNREAIETKELPESLIVLGGGAIGCELAQVFARFGSRVTVLEAASRLIGPEEPESSELLKKVFEDEGIDVRLGARAEKIRHDGGFTINDDVRAERLLVAIGRRPNLSALGLETVGLDGDARTVEVDDRLRAGDGLWAVGDITGKGAFTHVADYQARIATRDILGEDGPPADYRALPRVTFADPEIGAVGLTEQRAREQYGDDVRVYTTNLANNARGWLNRAEGFIKLIESEGRLVGGTSAGPMGGEILGALSVAVHGEVPVDRLRHMIYAFPTLHRALDAALA